MFSTKGQEVKGGGVPKSLQAGVSYAHIYDYQLRKSTKGDKMVLELFLSTPPIDGFEGWAIDRDNPEGPKHKGQVAKVAATSWTPDFNDPNIAKNEILSKITMMAQELNKRKEIDEIQADSLENWVSQAIVILKNVNAYWFLKGTEEEYNGKNVVKLSLPKYKFVSLDESKLDKFDKNNQYHFKALPSAKTVGNFEPVDDFNV